MIKSQICWKNNVDMIFFCTTITTSRTEERNKIKKMSAPIFH